MKTFISVKEAIKQLKQGKMLILVDHPNRENEGDFYIPSQNITPEAILTMIRYGGGLVCAAITQEQAFRLELPLMIKPQENTEKTNVNFTVSVNAKKGITTGVSAFDRAKTIRILASPNSKADDLTKPGHVFGLMAKNGGVLTRRGHTEAAVDLARLSGFSPSGVLCEIVGKSGKMADMESLAKLAEKLNIKILRIDDLVSYFAKNPLPKINEACPIIKTATATLPTTYGTFELSIYTSLIDGFEHAVLLMGEKYEPVLTRIHSQCLTGDTFASMRCDCGEQLRESMEKIAKKGSGVIMYLNQEGRGIGLANKIKAYALQEQGFDTVSANEQLGFPKDARDYEVAVAILKDLGISYIELLTNNPLKITELEKQNIKITCVPLEIKPNVVNRSYLAAKKKKLGHRLSLV